MKLKNVFKTLKSEMVKEQFYKTLEELPLWNWWQIKETENLKYLFHNYETNNVPTTEMQAAFESMVFNFEQTDNGILRLKADILFMKSKYLTDKALQYKHEYKSLEQKLAAEMESLSGAKKQTLNEFIDIIELTFKSIGSIDSRKISTARAYSLYYRAIDQLKKTNKINSEND